MMRVDDLVAAIAALQRSDLEAWIREELIVPRQEAGAPLFSDMEYARVRLISTLHYELEIDADTLPVVLSLIDQLYDTVADHRRGRTGPGGSGSDYSRHGSDVRSTN
jgi:chaperone modulatory protein CbpM